jgi:chromosome segregation ATPase
MKDTRIPGVEFSLESADLKKVSNKTIAEIHLEAHINDMAVFDAVQDKLDGLKIYVADDFHTQVNNLLKEENSTLEQRLQYAEEALRSLQEQYKSTVSFAQKREEELRRENESLRLRNEHLEVLERELQDLART